VSAAGLSSRPTRDGWVWAVGSAGLLVAALASGNNLVYAVAAPLWVVMLVAWPLGRWQLRGLQVRRALPPELTAGREATGELLVRNGRRRLGAFALRVRDVAAGAEVVLDAVSPGEVGRGRVRYRFSQRGRVALSRVEVRSGWPFGLVEHTATHEVPAEVVVYPRPLPGIAEPRAHDGPGDDEEPTRRGGGDFLGLRPYRDGDPPRQIHWLSSARAGALLVVERGAEVGDRVRVVVPEAHGGAWEQELSRAAGEVGRAIARGHAVSLVLPGGPPELDGPARAGAPGRRLLLHALAVAPERGGEP
jgi:uncharacterized protein (DUF58 family)